jgi:hypothetical protein
MKKKFLKFRPNHSDVWMTLPDGTVSMKGRRCGVRHRQTCFLDEKQFNDLVEKFGKEGAQKLKEASEKLEKDLSEKYKQMMEGNLKAEDFNKFKQEEIANINTQIKEIETLKGIVEKQGDKITELIDKKEANKGITLEEFFSTKVKDDTGREFVVMDRLTELYKAGTGVIEFTTADLKKAGVRTFSRKVATETSLTNTISAMDSPPGSPYLPGLGGSDLELFDIVRNPNFILNRVDVGRTNQSRLAWINETGYDGTPNMAVAEGAEKPMVSHTFKVEMSTAKKAAAYIILTEEFEDDVPGLATAIRRMLQAEVLRAFDSQIQQDVIDVAHDYEIVGLNGVVNFPTIFDAMGALLAQVGYYNFVPNTLAVNPVTFWAAMMDKDQEGRYLNPPFMDRLNRLLVEANKVEVGFGLAGDLSQYKVDIYKDFTLRIGWINDQLIKNKFTIVGELRYHSYISDNRKKAIVYDNLTDIIDTIEATS